MINVPNLAQSPLLNKNLNNKPQPPVQKQNAQAPKTTHTSWLYINDVHGKMTNMERIYNITQAFDKNILSVTYQTIDENARLIGYETDLDTMKRHLLSTLNEGENILIGYTQTDNNNIIINGHEITIVGYKQGSDGKVTFICNDTDDGVSKPIEYSEDYLLPKIHHAALPKHVVEQDMNIVPSWKEGLDMYKQAKSAA